MVYQTLTFEKSDYVGVIHIYPSANQKDIGRLSEDLADIYGEIVLNGEVRVVILRVLGDDASPLERQVSRTDDEMFRGFLPLSQQISKLDRPVIAAIQGDTVGLGMEVALACDIRIASETSCFGMSHIESGLIPWDGGTQRLSRLVGRGKALEMILTGEVIDAQEALRIGLVNRVVPKGELMEVAMKLAQEIASKGPIALRYAKEAIYKGTDMSLEQGLRLEADLYLLIHTSKDRTEGIQAFREKRAPKFEGK